MEPDNELKARAAARVGRTLRGKYRVDSVLGIGGMAVVYAATHRNLKRFALKILHPELSLRTDIRTRFLREGYAANALNHAGAVTILDDDVAEDGSAFLVMELLEGASVDALFEASGRKLTTDVVIDLACQLLDTLAVAHEKSVVHRDIKPGNLFLTHEGALKVLDFGIARVKAITSEGSTTNTGTMLGTPAFMAPEQAAGTPSEIDAETDLWGVGATMFTLLSGEFVHTGETPTQMAIQAATKPARSLAEISPGTPGELVAIVDRALAFAKKDRWPDARPMREALARARQALHGAPVSRDSLVALVAAHAKRSDSVKPEAPTLHAPSSDAELAPTLPQQATPAFTPVSALAHSTAPQAVATGGGVSTSDPSRSPGPVAAPTRGPGLVRPLIAVGAIAAAVAVGFALRGGSRPPQVPPPTAASVAVAPSVPQPPPTASSTPAPTASSLTVRLGIAPPTAAVEVDGTAAPVASGSVDLSGAPGSMHMVHIVAAGRDSTFPVLLTASGAVPPRLDLGGAPAPARKTATPAAPAATSAAPTPPPPATQDKGSVSRTME
jgi:serine/threonine-protein kinase